MHGDINTRDRYTTCIRCGRPFAYDSMMAFCTITSCDWYFGTKPEPEPRPLRAKPVTRVDTIERLYADDGSVVAEQHSTRPVPTPPRSTDLLAAERAVIAAARNYIASPSALRRVSLRRVVARLDIVEGPSKVIPFVNGRYANVDPD